MLITLKIKEMETKNYYVRCEYQGEYNKKQTDNRYIEAESDTEAKKILQDWNSIFEPVTNFKITECRKVNIEVKNVLTRATVISRKKEFEKFENVNNSDVDWNTINKLSHNINVDQNT
jgi:hypothetical protein